MKRLMVALLATSTMALAVPGFMASSPADADAMIARGFRAIAYWGDIWIYQTGLREGLAAVRESLFMTK